MSENTPSIHDCMQEINNAADKDMYSFGTRLTVDANGALGGDCLLFTITETIANALNKMRAAIPEAAGEVQIGALIPIEDNEAVAVIRNDRLGSDITCIAKGDFKDAIGDTACHYVYNAAIRVMRSKINIELTALNGKSVAIAELWYESLVNAMNDAVKADPEDIARNAERIFGERENVPSMSCR